MTDYRDQAIRDVAEAFMLSTSYINDCLVKPYTCDDERIAYAVAQRGRVLRLEAELKLQKGANFAQDERERHAAEQLGMVHNCDWPDAVADRVLELEAELKQWRGCGWAQYMQEGTHESK